MRLSPMRQVLPPRPLLPHIIDQGDPGCLAPGSILILSGWTCWFFDGRLQNDREGIAFEHSRFALLEQDACTARMHRVNGCL